MNDQTKVNNESSAEGQSLLNGGLAADLKYLRENLTQEQVHAVFEAATTISASYQHTRACHIMGQMLPLLRLHGILSRAYRVANVELRGAQND